MIRRVVTGHKGGKAVFVADGRPQRHHVFKHNPGVEAAVAWSEPALPSITSDSHAESVSAATTIVPPQGETRLVFLKVPPMSWAQEPDFDPAAAGQEMFAAMPDIAATFEADGATHRTDSIDYVIVLDGEVHLVLDDEEVLLKERDVVVQAGTRHAWRNSTDRPAMLAVVLIGAQREDIEPEPTDR